MSHRSRLAGFIIDCRTDDLAGAAGFWAAALGDAKRRKPQGKYVKLDPQAGLHVEVQKVEHESRVHLDIESDDIPAEVANMYAHLCPAGVYELVDGVLRVNAPNCVDCKATDVLGPRWTPREGGSGTHYRRM